MKIMASHDGGSGCAWYRMLVPLGAVERLADDVEVHFRSGGAKMMREQHPPLLVQEASEADVVVSQRSNSWEGLGMWRRWHTPDTRTVYENDDDIWNITHENELAYKSYEKGGMNREAVLRYCSTSNLVTVSTPHLGDWHRELTPHVPVVVLPNYVPEFVLDLKRDDRKGRYRIGWQGGASHARDIHTATGAVRRFIKRFPDWDLFLSGTDYRRQFKVAADRSFHVQWIHVCDYPEVFYRAIDFDIGICPLLDTQFARSKCLDAETRILTQRGVLRVVDVLAGDEVLRNGSWHVVQATEHSTPREGLLLELADGYQVRLTPEHRMRVNGNWKTAAGIKPGDVLSMETEYTLDRVLLQEVPWPSDSRMSRAVPTSVASLSFDPDAYLTATDTPKLTITPRWGRLLGAYAGDGSVGQSTVLTISCDGQDLDWIDLLTEDFRACGLNPRTETVTTYGGNLLRRRNIRVASAHLLRVLAALGLTTERSNGRPKRVVCVPEVIWKSPRPVIAEFLAGYFEADGHVKSAGLAATSKDEKLVRDVQRLLLLFGITSRVHKVTHTAQNGFTGRYWHVTLRKQEAALFEQHIGFRSARQQKRLANVTGKRHPNDHSAPVRWEREVTSVSRCIVTPVDLQVEGEEFTAAGFVSHNSHIKALEYMARGIPVVASDVEPYRKFITHGKDGFLCKNEHEWLSVLSELARDADLRHKMGAAAKEKARQHTIEGHYQEWVDAYKMLFPVGWEYKG